MPEDALAAPPRTRPLAVSYAEEAISHPGGLAWSLKATVKPPSPARNIRGNGQSRYRMARGAIVAGSPGATRGTAGLYPAARAGTRVAASGVPRPVTGSQPVV